MTHLGDAIVTNDDLDYFQRRAEIETERATQATLPQVVAAHYALATAYFDRVALLARGRAVDA